MANEWTPEQKQAVAAVRRANEIRLQIEAWLEAASLILDDAILQAFDAEVPASPVMEETGYSEARVYQRRNRARAARKKRGVA